MLERARFPLSLTDAHNNWRPVAIAGIATVAVAASNEGNNREKHNNTQCREAEEIVYCDLIKTFTILPTVTGTTLLTLDVGLE